VPRAEDSLARRVFLAVACPSDLYPKGRSAIRDHENCMFTDGRPLQAMAHVRQNLVVATLPQAGQRETLVARASVVDADRRRGVCRCEVFTTGAGRTETLCAPTQGTSVSVSALREA
jgi:hypothetical protein